MTSPDDGGGTLCSVCDLSGPCEAQGLCLDPTVICLNPQENAGARSDAVVDDGDLYDLSEPAPAPADVIASPTLTDAFLIEGQLVVRSEDGTWRPISMPAPRSDGPNSFHKLTPGELDAMRIPSDPNEARAYLLRQGVVTVPHGKHVLSLIHI